MSRSHTSRAKLNLDMVPLIVAAFLAILFALAIWAAMAPHPLPTDVGTAAVQGGL